MAQPNRTPPRSYIPAFLLRRGQKVGKGAGKKLSASQLPRTAELKQADVVSKSVDSLLSGASSISLPPEASLRSQPRSDRHSLHSHGTGGQVAPSAGQVRRHSCDFNAKDKSEDHEFYDCEDGVSEPDVTSSSQEPSPVIRSKEVRRGQKDSPEHWGSSSVRVKRQSTLSSLGASFSLTSDWDSAESDIDERSSNALDAESQTCGMSDDDNSSLTNSPVIAVHTTAGQVKKTQKNVELRDVDSGNS